MSFDRTAWTPEPTLVYEIGAQFDRTIDAYRIHPDLVAEHANHEESIRTGGYASRTLLELVQNAADALAGAKDTGEPTFGRVEIVLDEVNSVLYCANTGRPFSKNGLTAVTMAHLSGKRGDEIGRFGLGFKSVLAVSRAPQVLSRSIAFEFNSATARKELASVSSAKRLPVLRTATLLDAEAEIAADPVLTELAQWATTIVKLPDAMNLDRLRREIKQFSSEFLLFVSAVREVRLRVLGEEPFETQHVSRDLGDGKFRIERPDGSGDEWLVRSKMHAPSAEARREVGEAVSREKVKVTVAAPIQHSKLRIGQFWSYFRLKDRTSASALFNAPWSVNDDRTNLLNNQYNSEIIQTVASIFVPLLIELRGEEDPARHFDYLPARGRGQESHGFADDVLSAHILTSAGASALIPDAIGRVRNGNELQPLDLQFDFPAVVHQAWSESPHTGRNVPHWRCYTSNVRHSRLRDLLVVAQHPDIDPSVRDIRGALEQMPKRGLLSWFREWADGPDLQSSANALNVVIRHPKYEGISSAKVIPTSDGLKSLEDRSVVFLRGDEGLEIEDSVFVDSGFLALPDVESVLRKNGFRDLDPMAIFNARLAKFPIDPVDEDHEALWDAVLTVSQADAVKAIRASRAAIKVPAKDGTWAWPHQVVDLEVALPEEFSGRLLDHKRCTRDVARQIGVIASPVANVSLDDEIAVQDYLDATLTALNSRLGPGDRPIDQIEMIPGAGPGPVSVLHILRDGGADDRFRAQWTLSLLELPDQSWMAEDLDTGRTHSIESPVRWAVREAGLVPSKRGFRNPVDVVAPSLLRFGALLPLYQGPERIGRELNLPDKLEDVPPRILREMLSVSVFPGIADHEALAEFVLVASKLGYVDGKPSSIPARVGRTVEPRHPGDVFLASNDEEEEFLISRQRPYLKVSGAQVDAFQEIVGCRLFADSFSFSMVLEGEQEPARVLDVFTGLRPSFGTVLGSARIARAVHIAKRVVTEDGTEDQPLESHLDGQDLVVQSDVDDPRSLQIVNEAFELGLNNHQLDEVLRAGLAHQLEAQRQQARGIASDAERLEVYIGDDDLKDALPTGLWSALESQGLVDLGSSVAELFLTVYGSDALQTLAGQFRDAGFTDVPERWAGSDAAITWVRKMGFGSEFAGQRARRLPPEFVVPGAVRLNPLHSYQKQISEGLRNVLTQRNYDGQAKKGLVELPTGAGKTRVAVETVLRLFVDEVFSGPVLWIAQSEELCEQAVKTFQSVWRYLRDEKPMTIGRLWSTNVVHEPDTDVSVIVATDAKIEAIMGNPAYEWLKTPEAVIIDEAHRAGGSTRYTAILRWLGVDGRSWERPLVGLSATPFKGRADDQSGTKELVARFGSNRLSLPGDDAYQDLVKLGVLARVRHEILPSGVDIESDLDLDPAIRQSAYNDVKSKKLIDRKVYESIGRNEHRMRVLVEHILSTLAKHPDWPILVFTPSVLSAQVLAASLRYRDVAAQSVSGQTSRQQRRQVLDQFRAGDIRVLANCDLLVQGFDAPGVRVLYIARPTFSPGAYIQMAGRGLRGPQNGGKDECLIVDVEDNWGAMNDFLGYQDYKELWKEQH